MPNLKKHIDKGIRIIPYPFDTEAGSDGPFITRHIWMNSKKSQTFVLAQAAKIYTYGRLGHLEALEYISPALESLILKYVPGEPDTRA